MQIYIKTVKFERKKNVMTSEKGKQNKLFNKAIYS